MGQKIHREIQLKPQEAFWLDLMQLPHCIELEKEITPCASFIGKKRKRACLGY